MLVNDVVVSQIATIGEVSGGQSLPPPPPIFISLYSTGLAATHVSHHSVGWLDKHSPASISPTTDEGYSLREPPLLSGYYTLHQCCRRFADIRLVHFTRTFVVIYSAVILFVCSHFLLSFLRTSYQTFSFVQNRRLGMASFRPLQLILVIENFEEFAKSDDVVNSKPALVRGLRWTLCANATGNESSRKLQAFVLCEPGVHFAPTLYAACSLF